MEQEQQWVPPEVDPTRPSIARVYDAFLGGTHHYAVDREVFELVMQVMPDASELGRANRAFLRRVVRYLTAEAGIRQFIDIGSGLPTQGNVHEIAQELDPLAHVVYVDNDPGVHAHAQALLGDTQTTAIVTADLRRPDEIMNSDSIQRLINPSQPVGLLLFGILHHINDAEDPAGIMAYLRGALPVGSYLAISHFHTPGSDHPDDSQRAAEAERVFNQKLGTGRWRTREQILEYFGEVALVEPGLVPLSQWRPAPEPPPPSATHRLIAGGVGRK